jgi:FAD/FMN-containing dehydrogenase
MMQSTVGGALAKDLLGEKSHKYGSILDFVQQIRVVLANGEVIEVRPLSKKELSEKMGQTNFEGDIYRNLDTLLEDNKELVEESKKRFANIANRIGYNIYDVARRGEFNLLPLFVGSLGTLGTITEATLRVTSYQPNNSLVLVSLEEKKDLHEILPQLMKLDPSICNMINQAAIDQATTINPGWLGGLTQPPKSAIHLFIGFDDPKESDQKKKLKSLQKLVEKYSGYFKLAENLDQRREIEKIYNSISILLSEPKAQSWSVPVAEDVCLPTNKIHEYTTQAEEVYIANDQSPVMWGQAISGIVRMRPSLNLSELGDRQKLFKISESLYKITAELGGSISGDSGDGRTRSPYSEIFLGPELYSVMAQVKKIFDPHNVLNPGVKFANIHEMKSLMRDEFIPSTKSLEYLARP